jgi:hypothetical protein
MGGLSLRLLVTCPRRDARCADANSLRCDKAVSDLAALPPSLFSPSNAHRLMSTGSAQSRPRAAAQGGAGSSVLSAAPCAVMKNAVACKPVAPTTRK